MKLDSFHADENHRIDAMSQQRDQLEFVLKHMDQLTEEEADVMHRIQSIDQEEGGLGTLSPRFTDLLKRIADKVRNKLQTKID